MWFTLRALLKWKWCVGVAWMCHNIRDEEPLSVYGLTAPSKAHITHSFPRFSSLSLVMAGGNKGIMTEQPRKHFISARSPLPVKDSVISPNDKPSRDFSPLIYWHKRKLLRHSLLNTQSWQKGILHLYLKVSTSAALLRRGWYQGSVRALVSMERIDGVEWLPRALGDRWEGG